MKIGAGSKVKTARTWLCFQRPCASVVSGDVRVTMRITLLTRKCPAGRFALLLAGHPLRGWPARLRGHKGSGLWKVWTVPSPPLPSPHSPPLPCPALPSLPPSLPRAKFDQAGSSRLAEARECGAALAISEWTL